MSKDHFASVAIVSLSEKSFDFCENIFEVNFKVHFELNIKTSRESQLIQFNPHPDVCQAKFN